MKIIAVLRGLIAGLIITINCLIFPIFILMFYGITRLIPFKKLRRRCDQKLQNSPNIWTLGNNLALLISGYRIKPTQWPNALKEDKPYLVIANHQTWIDIIILYQVFNFKIPALKFFMKKELLWRLPVAGLTCKALGYPFMQRSTRHELRKNPSLKGKDVETTRRACQKFKTISSSLMNFVEGTRFSKAKKERQKSPYKNLLKPKAGGISIVLTEMQDTLESIIDVTIVYNTKNLKLWSFLTGGYNDYSY